MRWFAWGSLPSAWEVIKHLQSNSQKQNHFLRKNASHRPPNLTPKRLRVLCANLASMFHGCLALPAIRMSPRMWVPVVVHKVWEHGIKYPGVLNTREPVSLLEPIVNSEPTASTDCPPCSVCFQSADAACLLPPPTYELSIDLKYPHFKTTWNPTALPTPQAVYKHCL